MKLKEFKHRGQVLVFYALMIPVFILCGGVALDLGWYYLNVSRLQNAADAAVLAGASALVKANNAFDDYYVVQLASNALPADFDDYENVFKKNELYDNSNRNLVNYWKMDDETITSTLNEGRYRVEEYMRKNLADTSAVAEESDEWETVSATDGWSVSKKDGDKVVSGTIELKYKIVDAKNDVYGPLYYTVNITEKIKHFFMPGWFEDMDAPVRAVALLQPHDKHLINGMEELERTKVIDNWMYTKTYKDNETGLFTSGGRWNHYKADESNNKVKYSSGDANRTESVFLKTGLGKGSSGILKNEANNNHWYSQDEVDSINIDMRGEVQNNFSTDWDIGIDDVTKYNYSSDFTNGWSAKDGADKRILFKVEFDDKWEKRSSFADNDYDVLWARIESDPIIIQKGNSVYNSVRQITLNFNETNIDENDPYKYRPYCIFYTGPENIDYAKDSNGVLIRHSQPVVINLNEDINAILYFPESPVIINGNKNQLNGFVIAKCYLSSVTSDDMTGNTTFKLYDGFNEMKDFTGNFTEGTDSNGNTVYFKPNELPDLDKLNQDYPEENFTITEDNGKVVVRENSQANHYILLNYTKADHDKYTVIDDNGKLNENKTFAAYINYTYKEKYKAVSGLSDDKITAVTFPEDENTKNYNETTAIYWVENTSLSSTKTNSNYVKVLVNGSTMYVDKAQLPYVKVRTDKEYFYVCVSDLKLPASSDNVKGVRMIDNSYTDEQMNSSYKKVGNVTSTDADIYINDTSINIYGDSWKIPKSIYDNRNEWKKDKVEFAADNSYFMLKSELDSSKVATYRKITYSDSDGEKVKYAKVGEKLYYTKTYNNTKNPANYIIVDENGNMLTKPITPPEVLVAEDVAANNLLSSRLKSEGSTTPLGKYWYDYTRDPKPEELPGDKFENIIDGKYRGEDVKHRNRDYRIPALERVYHKSIFNLSDDSMYNYFQIEELWRVNYTYLNVDVVNHKVNRKNSDYWKVDDMFFTQDRALWID